MDGIAELRVPLDVLSSEIFPLLSEADRFSFSFTSRYFYHIHRPIFEEFNIQDMLLDAAGTGNIVALEYWFGGKLSGLTATDLRRVSVMQTNAAFYGQIAVLKWFESKGLLPKTSPTYKKILFNAIFNEQEEVFELECDFNNFLPLELREILLRRSTGPYKERLKSRLRTNGREEMVYRDIFGEWMLEFKAESQNIKTARMIFDNLKVSVELGLDRFLSLVAMDLGDPLLLSALIKDRRILIDGSLFAEIILLKGLRTATSMWKAVFQFQDLSNAYYLSRIESALVEACWMNLYFWFHDHGYVPSQGYLPLKESVSGNSEEFTCKDVAVQLAMSVKASPLDPKLYAYVKLKAELFKDLPTQGSDSVRLHLHEAFGWSKEKATALSSAIFYRVSDCSHLLLDISPRTSEGQAEVVKVARSGFHDAVREGVLCDSYVHGVCFELTKMEIPDSSSGDETVLERACRGAMLQASPILLTAIFVVSITSLLSATEDLRALFGICKSAKVTVTSTRDIMMSTIEGATFEEVLALRKALRSSKFSSRIDCRLLDWTQVYASEFERVVLAQRQAKKLSGGIPKADSFASA